MKYGFIVGTLKKCVQKNVISNIYNINTLHYIILLHTILYYIITYYITYYCLNTVNYRIIEKTFFFFLKDMATGKLMVEYVIYVECVQELLQVCDD